MASVAFNPSPRNMPSAGKLVACRPPSFMSRSNNEVRDLSALLQHENSNYVALVCATTKPHTVVCPLDMEQAIAYLRVSTQRQHRSGLGIDAQRSAIDRFAATESLKIAAEYVEAETGKGSDALDRRPQLAAALAAAKAAKCSVVVAKLDRLIARRGICGWPDGPTRTVHRRRAWPGCRSIHAASLCRVGRKRASIDI